MGVIFRVIFCMVLLDNITIKSQIVTLFPHFGKLPYFPFKLRHFMSSENCTLLSLSPLNTQTFYQKEVTFYNFRKRSSHRNDCFQFFFKYIYYFTSTFSKFVILTWVFVRTYFRTIDFIITYLLSLFSIFFGCSVISLDTQKGIITNFLGYFFIYLGISIISTYRPKF